MSFPSPPDRASDAAPLPLSDELAIERIRRSLLHRMAEDSTSDHLTVPASAADWQAFMPGIEIKVLHDTRDTLSYLLRLQPDAVLPAHRHSQDEECVVVDGEICIGNTLVVAKGGYHLARAGALHAQITTQTGALIFLRGAEPVIGDAL